MKGRVGEVLRDLVSGFSVSEVQRNRGYKYKQSVEKVVNRYVNKGVLVGLGKGFVFSEKGLKLFSKQSFIGDGKRMVEVHKIAYVVPIVKHLGSDFLVEAERLLSGQGDGFFGWNYSLPNAEILVHNFFYATVRITRDCFRIQPKPFVSGSVDGCLDACERFVSDLLPKIEKFFMCVLDRKGVWTELSLSERHIAFVKHPFALAVERRGYRLRVLNDVGELMYYSDGSLGEDGVVKYHLETNHKVLSDVYAKNMESHCKDVGDGFSLRKNAEDVEAVRSELDTLRYNVNIMSVQGKELYSNFGAYNENIKLHLEAIRELRDAVKELREEVKVLKKN